MASNIKRCRRNPQRPSGKISSAEIIGGNDDLVVEILQRIPAKSLIRLRSVSKTWLSLISSHGFSLLWQQHRHSKISGLFFTRISQTEIKYIPLIDLIDSSCNSNSNSNSDGRENKSLVLVPDMHTTIIDSCNGFLLCSDSRSSYHVYNPTTKQFSTLPWPFLHTTCPRPLVVDHLLYLAFDPLKSLHYKVVVLQRSLRWDKNLYSYQLHIYSSETNEWWRPFGEDDPFSAPAWLDINNGVYCNGSIHWFSFWPEEASIYFDVDQERLCPMPSPPYRVPYKFRHFAESRDHLYLTEYSDYESTFHVCGMESDYKWSLKYRVDLNAMVDILFEKMIVRDEVSVLCLFHGEDEGDVFLVLLVGTNMIISYSIKDNTFKKLYDVAHSPHSSLYELLWFKNCHVHPHIETLFPL